MAFRQTALAAALPDVDTEAPAAAAVLSACRRWQAADAVGTLPTYIRHWVEWIGVGSGEGLWAGFEVPAGAHSTSPLAWLRPHRGVPRRGTWLDAAQALGMTLSVQTAISLARPSWQGAPQCSSLLRVSPGLSTLRKRGMRLGVVTNGHTRSAAQENFAVGSGQPCGYRCCQRRSGRRQTPPRSIIHSTVAAWRPDQRSGHVRRQLHQRCCWCTCGRARRRVGAHAGHAGKSGCTYH